MIRFTIYGKPYAKKRPRFSRKNGRAYDPASNSQYEGTVAQIALQYFPKPIVGPVRVEIVAVFEPAKSWPKNKRAAHLHRPHTQKPDGDNCVKAIMDGLTRIVWVDDSQIYDHRCQKFWGVTDHTVVTITPFDPMETTGEKT